MNEKAAALIPEGGNDPWRRTMGLNLRSEAAKFILTAFNLDVFSDQAPGSAVSLANGITERWFAERFGRFLATEPEAHWVMDHRRFISLRARNAVTDVSLCEYAPDGGLKKVTPFFDARQPAEPESEATGQARQAVLEAFNRTRMLPEIKRPQELTKILRRALSGTALRTAERIVASTAISFQNGPSDAAGRFAPPDFLKHRGFGVGPMAALCRRSPDGRGIDLWLQCHHAALDGGPAQEMLDRLEQRWGVTEPVVLPADDPERKAEPLECHAEQERRTGLLTDFIDFSPLQALRRELAGELAPHTVENVPLGALFMWCLSHQPEFTGAGINTAVDVPPDGKQGRAVDLVTVFPSRFHGQADGLVQYLKLVNRLFADARVRKTATWKKLCLLNSLPAFLASTILAWKEDDTKKTFGSLTVSLVKGTKLVIAPMPDSAWDHGFIAVGTVGVPGAGGRPVTPVSIKGTPERIRSYPAAIRRAVSQCRTFVR